MTSKSISITCNSDDTVALNAFSNALREMAQLGIMYVAEEASCEGHRNIAEVFPNAANVSVTETPVVEMYPTDQYIKMSHNDHNANRYAKSDTELEQMKSEGWMVEDSSAFNAQLLLDSANLDSDGLPWDARIHSTNKARNADDTWRLRRKPKDMTDDQWQETIKSVQEELEYLMAIDATGEEEGEFVITSQTPVGYPIPVPGSEGMVSQGYVVTVEPVVPPVPVAPPLPHSNDVGILSARAAPAPVEAMTFPKLMSFLTERFGKITVEQVNELVAKHGLTNIQQFAQRPDLIGAFVADVKTLLGE